MEFYGNLNISPYAQMTYLAHHGILGMKHGERNGPPYPLGSGAHSSSETRAAKSAGISVGSSSGKGSIDNVKSGKKVGFFEKQKAKKQAKADEEEKKRKVEEAATNKRRSDTLKRLRSEGNGFDGDDDPEYLDNLYEKYKKKDFDDNISKMRSSMKNSGYSDDEIEARVKKVAGEGYKPVAQNTERTAKQYEREQEKANAIARGDARTLYTKYASEMSTDEISRVNDRISKMNTLRQNVPKEPTTLDKVEAAVNTLDRVNKMAGKLIGVYNTAASVNNTLRPNNKWVRIDGGGGNKKNDPVKDAINKTLSNAVNDAAKQQDKDKKK